jgi:peptidyl-prolyl cis-trans isomerase B (cyclophilin B)
VVGAILLVAALVGGSLFLFHLGPGGGDVPKGAQAPAVPPPGSATPAASHLVGPTAGVGRTDHVAVAPATSVAGACRYWKTAATGPDASLPAAADQVPTTPVTMTLRTSYGTLVAELNAAAAPCAVYAMRALADDHYYDGSYCPRETIGSAALVSVLRCGDPTGTGSGSPGFAYAAEHPAAGDFGPGTLAMATTTRPDTNGGQFLISYADPTPDGLKSVVEHYTVIGEITHGLDVLDRLVGKGITSSGHEGPPASEARILSVSLSE